MFSKLSLLVTLVYSFLKLKGRKNHRLHIKSQNSHTIYLTQFLKQFKNSIDKIHFTFQSFFGMNIYFLFSRYLKNYSFDFIIKLVLLSSFTKSNLMNFIFTNNLYL